MPGVSAWGISKVEGLNNCYSCHKSPQPHPLASPHWPHPTASGSVSSLHWEPPTGLSSPAQNSPWPWAAQGPVCCPHSPCATLTPHPLPTPSWSGPARLLLPGHQGRTNLQGEEGLPTLRSQERSHCRGGQSPRDLPDHCHVQAQLR